MQNGITFVEYLKKPNYSKLLTLSHEYKPRLLTIRKEEEFVICSYCGSSNFNNIKSKRTKFNDGGAKLIECAKQGCKAIRDLKLISEDVKHAIYHDTGKEPEHKDLFEKT